MKKILTNALLMLLIALILALLCGFLGLLLPQPTRGALTEYVLSPISDAVFGLLNLVTGPMIFFSVCDSIAGFDDEKSLGRVGGRLAGRVIAATFALAALALAVFAPVFRPAFAFDVVNRTGLAAIVQPLRDIFPSDMLSPFSKGNTLQVVFLAVFAGILLLKGRERFPRLRGLVGEANHAAQTLTTWVSYLLPLLIFAMLISQIWDGSLKEFTALWQPVAAASVLMILLTLIMTFVTSRRTRFSFGSLLKAMMPAVLIGFATCSSAAAHSKNKETCEKSFGIDPQFTDFGLPLTMVLYKPAAPIGFAAVALFAAASYHIAISPVWLLTAMLIISLMALAVPPVGGAAALCYAVIFSQLGLPEDALPMALTVSMLLDFIGTAFNIALRQLLMLRQAKKNGQMTE